MNKTTEKIIALINKYETDEEILESWSAVKDAYSKKLKEAQDAVEDKANRIQSTLDRINGN